MNFDLNSDPRFSFLQGVSGADTDVVHSLVAGTAITLVFGSSATDSLAGQILGYQLATLTYRLFDRVELKGDEKAVAQDGLGLLSGTYLAALRKVLPTLRPDGLPREPTGRSVTVGIGVDAGAADMWLGCSAWAARYSTVEPQVVEESMTTVGALAAGTFGASEIFKHVFKGYLNGSVYSPGYTLSLLDYRAESQSDTSTLDISTPDRIDLDATLFGCGSIGCGFLLGMLLSPQLRGRIVIVDNGRFDGKNAVKYQLMDRDAGSAAAVKAAWAADTVSHSAGGRFAVTPFVGTAENYVASLPTDYLIPLAISAVDTREARVEIQDTLPQTIVNAGIEGTSVEVSVHGFGSGPCLACLQLQVELESWNAGPIAAAVGLTPDRAYQLIVGNKGMNHEDLEAIKVSGVLPPEKVDEYIDQPLLSLWQRAAYSQAQVQVGGMANAQVTTAFVSAFAGVLLVAELIKRAVPALHKYSANAYQQNLLGIPADGKFSHERDTTGQCLCHSSFRLAVYKEKYNFVRVPLSLEAH